MAALDGGAACDHSLSCASDLEFDPYMNLTIRQELKAYIEIDLFDLRCLIEIHCVCKDFKQASEKPLMLSLINSKGLEFQGGQRYQQLSDLRPLLVQHFIERLAPLRQHWVLATQLKKLSELAEWGDAATVAAIKEQLFAALHWTGRSGLHGERSCFGTETILKAAVHALQHVANRRDIEAVVGEVKTLQQYLSKPRRQQADTLIVRELLTRQGNRPGNAHATAMAAGCHRQSNQIEQASVQPSALGGQDSDDEVLTGWPLWPLDAYSAH